VNDGFDDFLLDGFLQLRRRRDGSFVDLLLLLYFISDDVLLIHWSDRSFHGSSR